MILLRPSIDAQRATLKAALGATRLPENHEDIDSSDGSPHTIPQQSAFLTRTNDLEPLLHWLSPQRFVSGRREGCLSRLKDQRNIPLRLRIAALTAILVAVIVILMSTVAYATVYQSLTFSLDNQLEDKASTLLTRIESDPSEGNVERLVPLFKSSNPTIRISLNPSGSVHYYGDNLSALADATKRSGEDTSIKTVGNERVITKTGNGDSSVVLARGLTDIHTIVLILAVVLLGVALTGVLLAIFAGYIVASVALRPIADLQETTEYIAKTDDLRPIEISGKDEIANLAQSFNSMLAALSDSRRKQAEFVADAGHELKTPLTSMRTNIEMLLMMQNEAVKNKFTAEDMAEMEHDIMAQMDELTQLVQDLVDLSRGESKQSLQDDVDMEETLFDSMERVKNRRQDVTFRLETFPWAFRGDAFGMSRAVVNLMDNAAKWSPPNGVVRVKMIPVSEDAIEITFSDSGPGISPEERSKVFQRFYRSVEARKMPGSGLGLSIVHQTVEKHGGTITAEESDDGGAMIRIHLPSNLHNKSTEPVLKPENLDDVAHLVQKRGSNSRRVGEEFIQKWSRQR